MTAVTYSHARNALAKTMRQVCSDHNPVLITSQNHQSVVMMSLEDFESLTETAYLMKSPANARRLMASVEQLGKKQ